MEQKISRFLEERKKDGLLRKLAEVFPGKDARIRVAGREFINFSSNDYLGLSAHPQLIEAAREALEPVVGSSASRLMTGSTGRHHELERRVALFKNKEAALVLNSGYQANVGIISALCGKDDVIFFDKLSHASIVDGVRLSGAAFFRFRHSDTEHLEELLRRERGKFRYAMIITETVFSMDGDIAPVEQIVGLKKKYECLLMLDEAHATGIFEKTGDIDIVMGTFSKALGSFGAYAATSSEIRDYLVNACRSFIYSTALPPSVIAANMAALDVVEREPQRGQTLLANADHLRLKLKESGFSVKGSSQIIPVILRDNENALCASEFLKEKGYWVLPVKPPTVPQGQARLRISLTFDHKREDIDKFLNDIKKGGDGGSYKI
ncbi:MAG: 8-amino-7-oxononanoate synthase [Candidatus Omnitrophota bacterium]